MSRRITASAVAALLGIALALPGCSKDENGGKPNRPASEESGDQSETSGSEPTEDEVAGLVEVLKSGDPDALEKVISSELRPFAEEIAASAIPEGSSVEVDHASLELIAEDLATVEVMVGGGEPQVMLLRHVDGAWLLEGTTSVEEEVP